MDRPIPIRRGGRLAIAVGILVVLCGVALLVRLVPHGLRVTASDIRVGIVERGIFRNDIVVRATAAPLHTIILDALDTGRVEEVLVNDGAQVKKGELLYRLSNPQLRLDLVAREADRAQQISNLANLRVGLETTQTEHERRRLDLKYALAQVERQHARLVVLAHDGVIPVATLEDAQDRFAQQRQALEDEDHRAQVEVSIKHAGIRQMEQAIRQLDAGLKVVNDSIEARSPCGRLLGDGSRTSIYNWARSSRPTNTSAASMTRASSSSQPGWTSTICRAYRLEKKVTRVITGAITRSR